MYFKEDLGEGAALKCVLNLTDPVGTRPNVCQCRRCQLGQQSFQTCSHTRPFQRITHVPAINALKLRATINAILLLLLKFGICLVNHFWKKNLQIFVLFKKYALRIQFCTRVYHPGNITEQHYKIAYSNSSSSKCISVIAYFKNLRVNYMAKAVSFSTFAHCQNFINIESQNIWVIQVSYFFKMF